MDRRLLLCAAVLCSAAVAQAQIAISPRAGLIHHVEGEVRVDGAALDVNPGPFSHLEPGRTLQTVRGRIELILSPSSILRADDATRFQLLSDEIERVELRLIAGSLLIKLRDQPEGSSTTVWLGENAIRLAERGVYRLDAEPCGQHRLRVMRGLATVTRGGIELHPRTGHSLALDSATTAPQGFDRSHPDVLNEWSKERDQVLAVANRIRPYSNRRFINGLAFLARNGQSGTRPSYGRGIRIGSRR